MTVLYKWLLGVAQVKISKVIRSPTFSLLISSCLWALNQNQSAATIERHSGRSVPSPLLILTLTFAGFAQSFCL